MPPVVVELGQLAGLVYRSSKWVGRPRTYIHFMDDPPRLVSDVTGRRLFIVGGSYRVTTQGDRRMNLGLDELMIVNPGSPPSDTTWFLGEDGGLYRVSSRPAIARAPRCRTR